MDIEKTLQRYEKAFQKLGIAFCPNCEERKRPANPG